VFGLVSTCYTVLLYASFPYPIFLPVEKSQLIFCDLVNVRGTRWARGRWYGGWFYIGRYDGVGCSKWANPVDFLFTEINRYLFLFLFKLESCRYVQVFFCLSPRGLGLIVKTPSHYSPAPLQLLEWICSQASFLRWHFKLMLLYSSGVEVEARSIRLILLSRSKIILQPEETYNEGYDLHTSS